jgi:glyoxylase-like metal-dependent hydrolase (beta-lactamase superfamily II)
MNASFRPLHHPVEVPPEPGKAIELAEGVLWLRMPLPMVLDHVNVYALDDGDGWTLIDTGFDSRKTRAIWRDVLDGPLKGKPVKRVLVTHHHPDHIGLAGWFQAEYGAELVTTRTAWLMARMLVLDEQPVAAPETVAFWRAAGMDPEILAVRLAERPFNFSDVVAPLPLGFRRIQEGDRITIGGRNWDIRMGNGHAPEHATLWADDDSLVIGGDQLLSTISPNIGVYATEPDADPLGEWLEACERLQNFARDGQLVLPGHKLPFVGLPVRMRQLIDNHHGALKRLKLRLQEPHTTAECFSALFKRKIGGGEYGLALVEAVAHVNHLFLLGEISRTRRDDGAWLWKAKDEQ